MHNIQDEAESWGCMVDWKEFPPGTITEDANALPKNDTDEVKDKSDMTLPMVKGEVTHLHNKGEDFYMLDDENITARFSEDHLQLIFEL